MNTKFYIPADLMPSAERKQAWREGRHQVLEQSGKIACAQCWIYQTWLHLQNSGAEVEIVHEMPCEGIAVAITGNIPAAFRADRELFLIGIVADGFTHRGSHLHIVQNAAHKARLPRSVFMPLWTQPGLLPREKERGQKFERVAFFGDERNIAPEISNPAWRERLRAMTGCELEIRTAERWHDYSSVDAVVAVRDFRNGRHLHKPATKLYNAWTAGVPFIGGPDSAYSAEGEQGRSYLVARSPDEVIACVDKLKQNERFRASLVEEGRKKAADYSNEAIAARWRQLLERVVPELAMQRKQRPQWFNSCIGTAMQAFCAADRFFRS